MPPRCEIRNLIPEAQEFVRGTLEQIARDRTGNYGSRGYGHAQAVLATGLKMAAESGMSPDRQREFWRENGLELVNKYGLGAVRFFRKEIQEALRLGMVSRPQSISA